MSTQHDLFRPMCGRQSAVQGELFPLGWAEESDLSSCECGARLVQTPSDYLACPNGHGRLLPVSEPCGKWFDDEPGQE
jgi:hypothetical protein